MMPSITWFTLAVLLGFVSSIDLNSQYPLVFSNQRFPPGVEIDSLYPEVGQTIIDTKKNDPNTEENRASLACDLAQLLFEPVRNAVLDAQDERYNNTIQMNWSKDCWLRPRCVIQPSNTMQVQLIMKIVSRTAARFAVRGGGQNPNRGWGSIGDNGILIDLSRLDKLHLHSDKASITVGAGNRWLDVYERLESTNRTVLGGRMPDVGVGGLLLGCGIPNFASEFGLACDFVRRVEVVLGNGSVVIADKSSHADLWWALKGGGPNFGMMISVTSQALIQDGPVSTTYALPDIWPLNIP